MYFALIFTKWNMSIPSQGNYFGLFSLLKFLWRVLILSSKIEVVSYILSKLPLLEQPNLLCVHKSPFPLREEASSNTVVFHKRLGYNLLSLYCKVLKMHFKLNFFPTLHTSISLMYICGLDINSFKTRGSWVQKYEYWIWIMEPGV